MSKSSTVILQEKTFDITVNPVENLPYVQNELKEISGNESISFLDRARRLFKLEKDLPVEKSEDIDNIDIKTPGKGIGRFLRWVAPLAATAGMFYGGFIDSGMQHSLIANIIMSPVFLGLSAVLGLMVYGGQEWLKEKFGMESCFQRGDKKEKHAKRLQKEIKNKISLGYDDVAQGVAQEITTLQSKVFSQPSDIQASFNNLVAERGAGPAPVPASKSSRQKPTGSLGDTLLEKAMALGQD